MTREELFITVARIIAKHQDSPNVIWWKHDLQVFMVCNDLFAWGGSDLEEITADDIELLEGAYTDAAALGEEDLAGLLFVARKRKMRPQGAYYAHFKPALAELFDACGPKREVGLLNPCENIHMRTVS